MKVLSVQAPWADLIVGSVRRGLIKDVENRTRPTHYRGLLLIHRTKPASWKAFAEDIEWLTSCGLIDGRDYGRLKRLAETEAGCVCGAVKLVDCVSRLSSPWFQGPVGYVLEDPVFFNGAQIRIKGLLGLFDPPADALGLIEEQLDKAGVRHAP